MVVSEQNQYWVTIPFGPIMASSEVAALRSVVEDLNRVGIAEDGSGWVGTAEPTEPLGAVLIDLEDEEDDYEDYEEAGEF